MVVIVMADTAMAADMEETVGDIVLASGIRVPTTTKDLPRHDEGFIRRATDLPDSMGTDKDHRQV